MRAINHSLTGAIIGLTVANPVAAVSLALVSHYILDAIPHHGDKDHDEDWIRSRLFFRLLLMDVVLCGLLVMALAVRQPVHWQLGAVCAFVAAAPDFMSINHFRKSKAKQSWKPNFYGRFTHDIQWFEKPIGWVVEIAWFAGALAILLPLLRLE